jgi:iron-sulfur cluster insertion protein
MSARLLSNEDLSVTGAAQAKFAELFQQVGEEVVGVRVFATPGGCSGVSFGMSFTDQVDGERDGVLECDGFSVVVDDGAMQYLQGVEIDFLDRGDGNASFVFNNLQPVGGGGCGTCGSSGGGCA